MKYSFKNDYSEGAHPRILDALIQHNLTQQSGYGLDEYSLEAANIIREKFEAPHAAVHLVSGGTQANLTVISAFLKPHESVVAAHTGHIFTHEAGAIEATGHKIHAVPTIEGKLTPAAIQNVIDEHQNFPHQLKQKLVYISHSTEMGTIYSKKELQELHAFCKSKNLILFMDGARLAHALAAESSDLGYADIAKFTDAFYLGGTKNGALIGEAVVITHPGLQDEFGFHLKQKGALLAKGRLLGIQFQELMRDGLYFELAKHANLQAMKIKAAFSEMGCEFLAETFTNQIFPVLNVKHIEQLAENYDFYVWKKINGEKSAIRLMTSWATNDETVADFIKEIKKLE